MEPTKQVNFDFFKQYTIHEKVGVGVSLAVATLFFTLAFQTPDFHCIIAYAGAGWVSLMIPIVCDVIKENRKIFLPKAIQVEIRNNNTPASEQPVQIENNDDKKMPDKLDKQSFEDTRYYNKERLLTLFKEELESSYVPEEQCKYYVMAAEESDSQPIFEAKISTTVHIYHPKDREKAIAKLSEKEIEEKKAKALEKECADEFGKKRVRPLMRKRLEPSEILKNNEKRRIKEQDETIVDGVRSLTPVTIEEQVIQVERKDEFNPVTPNYSAEELKEIKKRIHDDFMQGKTCPYQIKKKFVFGQIVEVVEFKEPRSIEPVLLGPEGQKMLDAMVRAKIRLCQECIQNKNLDHTWFNEWVAMQQKDTGFLPTQAPPTLFSQPDGRLVIFKELQRENTYIIVRMIVDPFTREFSAAWSKPSQLSGQKMLDCLYQKNTKIKKKVFNESELMKLQGGVVLPPVFNSQNIDSLLPIDVFDVDFRRSDTRVNGTHPFNQDEFKKQLIAMELDSTMITKIVEDATKCKHIQTFSPSYIQDKEKREAVYELFVQVRKKSFIQALKGYLLKSEFLRRAVLVANQSSVVSLVGEEILSRYHNPDTNFSQTKAYGLRCNICKIDDKSYVQIFTAYKIAEIDIEESKSWVFDKKPMSLYVRASIMIDLDTGQGEVYLLAPSLEEPKDIPFQYEDYDFQNADPFSGSHKDF